jgi:hypothetical protein
MLRGSSLGLAALVLGLGGSVQAQMPASGTPIAAVVEVQGSTIEPASVRAAVADRLSRPVLSPIEIGDRPTGGTLTVACSGRRAIVHYRDVSGREETREIDLDTVIARAVASIGDIAAALVRRTSEPFMLPSEVLDPFSTDARPPMQAHYSTNEVLNPWEAIPRTNPAAALAPWPTDVRTTPPPPAAAAQLPLPPPPVPPTVRPAGPPHPIERAADLTAPQPGVGAF